MRCLTSYFCFRLISNANLHFGKSTRRELMRWVIANCAQIAQDFFLWVMSVSFDRYNRNFSFLFFFIHWNINLPPCRLYHEMLVQCCIWINFKMWKFNKLCYRHSMGSLFGNSTYKSCVRLCVCVGGGRGG